MSLKFTGDESLTQVLDRLLSNTQELYGKELRVFTSNGAFQGEFVGKGSHFVRLRTETGRWVNAEPNQQVIQHSLIAISTITGISFDRLEEKKGEGGD